MEFRLSCINPSMCSLVLNFWYMLVSRKWREISGAGWFLRTALSLTVRLVIVSCHRVDSRFAPSQWGTALLCSNVSHWLVANRESALCHFLEKRPQIVGSTGMFKLTEYELCQIHDSDGLIYCNLNFWLCFIIYFFMRQSVCVCDFEIAAGCHYRADSRLAPSQWETLLQNNVLSWLAWRKPRISPALQCCLIYNMILHTILQWLMQNINQSLNSQKTPHVWPSQMPYGVPIVRI